MPMSETLMLLVASVTGLVLGAIFFGGLWWTVRKGVSSPQPALWFLGSTLLRMCLVLVGFYLIGREHWDRMLVCLIGFVIARFLVLRTTRAPIEHPDSRTKEARHAP
jgi:F1F0 ATPase subunit 2